MSSNPDKPVADQSATATTSVTVRHPRVFKIHPGEKVAWTFGTQRGNAVADAKGEITVDKLQLASSDSSYTKLVLSK